jgi:RND family efflux transporter MFP subunit
VPLITWGITGTLLLVTVVFLVIGATRTPAPPTRSPQKLANVQTILVKAQEHHEVLELPAKLMADRSAVLSAELNGRLEKWLVGEGEKVTAGAILAELNTDLLKARLAQATAEHLSAVKAETVAKKQLEGARVGLKQAENNAEDLSVDLELAQANLELSQKRHDRIIALSKENVTTESAVDDAVNELTQKKLVVQKAKDAIELATVAVNSATVRVAEAEAGVAVAEGKTAEAKAKIDSIEVDMAKTRLSAPIAGRLEEHLVEPGEVIAAGTPLARIYDLSHVRAVVDVPDRYVPFLDSTNPAVSAYIKRAMPKAKQAISASIELPGMPKLTGGTYQGLKLSATLSRIAQASDPASNTFKVELRLPNPEEALKEGMIVSARIAYLIYPEAITIPLAAIQVADVGPRALVVEEREGKTFAAVRDIVPISIKDDQILVSEGIEDGDHLIVAGGKGVLDGEAVNVIIADGVLNEKPSGSATAMN